MDTRDDILFGAVVAAGQFSMRTPWAWTVMSVVVSVLILLTYYNLDDRDRQALLSSREMVRLARIFRVFPLVAVFNVAVAVHYLVTGWTVIFRDFSIVLLLTEGLVTGFVALTGRPRFLTPPFTRGW